MRKRSGTNRRNCDFADFRGEKGGKCGPRTFPTPALQNGTFRKKQNRNKNRRLNQIITGQKAVQKKRRLPPQLYCWLWPDSAKHADWPSSRDVGKFWQTAGGRQRCGGGWLGCKLHIMWAFVFLQLNCCVMCCCSQNKKKAYMWELQFVVKCDLGTETGKQWAH